MLKLRFKCGLPPVLDMPAGIIWNINIWARFRQQARGRNSWHLLQYVWSVDVCWIGSKECQNIYFMLTTTKLAPAHHLPPVFHFCPNYFQNIFQVPLSSFGTTDQYVVKMLSCLFKSFRTKKLEHNPTVGLGVSLAFITPHKLYPGLVLSFVTYHD